MPSELRKPRIPLALQQVFLEAQRGEQVSVAPKSACRNFGVTSPSSSRHYQARMSLPDGFIPQWRKHERASKPKQEEEEKKDSDSSTSSSSRLVLDWTKPASERRRSSSTKERPPPTLSRDTKGLGSASNKPLTLKNAMMMTTRRSDTGKDISRRAVRPNRIVSPQDYLNHCAQAYGASLQTHFSLQTAYAVRPTPLQQASYGTNMVSAIRNNDTRLLQRLLEAGLSPNPCNSMGESLLHMACRRGHTAILQLLLDYGATVQVTDDYGRTPLHDACWGGSLETVALVAKCDPQLWFLKDSRGTLALGYAAKHVPWNAWRELVDDCAHVWWTRSTTTNDDDDNNDNKLVTRSPQSRFVQDPPNALAIDLCARVANGELEPEEAQQLQASREEDSSSDYSTACSSVEDDSCSSSCSWEDCESSDEWGSSKEALPLMEDLERLLKAL